MLHVFLFPSRKKRGSFHPSYALRVPVFIQKKRGSFFLPFFVSRRSLTKNAYPSLSLGPFPFSLFPPFLPFFLHLHVASFAVLAFFLHLGSLETIASHGIDRGP
jgi:hypothetical protein